LIDWLWLLIGLLLLLALAQPSWRLSQGSKTILQQQADGVIVLESSVSMLLTEADGQSRLAQSQAWVAQLLAQRDAHARTGLVVFGDDAYQVLSATTDNALVNEMLQRVNPALAGRGDSAVLEGLTLAAAELVKKPSKSSWILLVHDGSQSVVRGSLQPVVAWAKQHDIRLAVMTVGAMESPMSSTMSGLIYTPRSDALMQTLAAQGAISASMDDALSREALRTSLLATQPQSQQVIVAGQTLDLMPYLLALALLLSLLPWLLERRCGE
jgi:hypothetical protein